MVGMKYSINNNKNKNRICIKQRKSGNGMHVIKIKQTVINSLISKRNVNLCGITKEKIFLKIQQRNKYPMWNTDLDNKETARKQNWIVKYALRKNTSY